MTHTLFEQPNSLQDQPLAARMRPRNLDEFIGQEPIMAPGRLLRRAIKADQISSLIFYGPPGTGKTTLAQLIALTTKGCFISLNAVLSGLKELREALDQAKEQKRLYSRKTILFIDEVHRWNKSQQDALLPWTENGTIILIGATTENPFFEVNKALVSRSRLFALQSLTDDNLMMAAKMALCDKERGYGDYAVTFEDGALEHLIAVAKGDCRMLYNALELAVETTPKTFPPPKGESIVISTAIAEESIQQKALLYDKDGDYHYDTISAFIKSIRGSDPDAALYWLARMLLSGEDPAFIWRRLLILSSEDIGLADPHAVVVVNACAMSYDRIGMPEGYIPLSQATLYLATAPKSNSALSIFDALKEVEDSQSNSDLPSHLKDSSRDGKIVGHGLHYKYPHAYTNHWIAQTYLPEHLKGRNFYRPGALGYEGAIALQVMMRKEEQLALEYIDEGEQIFGFAPDAVNKARDYWLHRCEADATKGLSAMREAVFNFYGNDVHATSLILGDKSGYLLAESLRRSPLGGHYSLVDNNEEQEQLTQQFSYLDVQERPIIIQKDQLASLPSCLDRMIIFLPRSLGSSLADIKGLIGQSSSVTFCLNGVGSRLSELVTILDEPLLGYLNKVEERSYRQLKLDFYLDLLKDYAIDAEFKALTWQEKRYLSKQQVEYWLDKGSFGAVLKSLCPATAFSMIRDSLMMMADQEVVWQRRVYIGATRGIK